MSSKVEKGDIEKIVCLFCILYKRGVYTVEEIRKYFVVFQSKLGSKILEYSGNRPYLKIPENLPLDAKVNLALEAIRKIRN